MQARSATERVFASSTVDESGCWICSLVGVRGYSAVKTGGRYTGASHRIAYEFCRGKIPDGMQLDHLCRVKNCVNPWHLEIVTGRENVLRGNTITAACAAKTHCPRGHAYDRVNAHGRRTCSVCLKIQWNDYNRNRRNR